MKHVLFAGWESQCFFVVYRVPDKFGTEPDAKGCSVKATGIPLLPLLPELF